MKRFTETTKWDDPWFRKMKPKFKAFFLFLCDRCDTAGVWVIDLELAATFVGDKIDGAEALRVFDGRVVALVGAKWLIPQFVSFQYGVLTERCHPHKRILEMLLKHSLKVGLDGKTTLVSSLPATPPSRVTTLEDKEKEEDKEEDKEEEKDKEGKEIIGNAGALALLLLCYLNEKAERSFEDCEENLKHIRGRLEDCAGDLEGCKVMIDRQVKLWKGDEQMDQYLRPATLFNKSKFRSYYDDRSRPAKRALPLRTAVTVADHAKGF